jgi:hypothetical protein
MAGAIPADLKPVLKKALAKSPDDRYPTSRDFAEALRQARSPSRRQQPLATVVLEAPTMRQPTPRRGLQSWLLAIPVVALAGGAFVVLRHQAAPTNETPIPATALPPTSPATTAPVPTPTLGEPPPSEAPATTLAARVTPPPSTRPARPMPEPTRTPISQAAAIVAPTPAPAMPVPIVAPPTTTAVGPAPVGAGLLQVAVRPWGEVSVDGTVMGTTPLDKLPLQSGTHLVRIRHPSYEIVERRITIRQGETERVVIDFPAEGVRKP